MRGADWIAIAPLAVLAGTPIVILLLIAWRRNHGMTAAVCVIGLAITLATLPLAAGCAPRTVTPLLVIDGYAIFYQGLIVAATLAVALLSYGYLQPRQAVPREEYYALLVLAALGAATLVASRHFASFFLGFEILSLSLVSLIGYPATIGRPIEASIKYLVLAGASSAFLLFGVALVYTQVGTLSFAAAPPLAAPQSAGVGNLYWLAGLALILAASGFKLSVVPFHLWAPDVYEGAPAPVSAFVAVVSKSALLALLLRYFMATGHFGAPPLTLILGAVAVLSMIVGNLLALLQDNVKRILAYSSIAHVGYALVGFLAGGALAVEAVSVYLAAYAITTLGAFAVVTLLSERGPSLLRPPSDLEHDVDSIAEYEGLYSTHPWLAFAFTCLLLSLAGIPLTIGFIAKFYAVTAGVGARLNWLLGALVLGSVLGLYYYLRVIVAMIRAPSAEACRATALGSSWLGHTVLAVLVAALLATGLYPTPLVTLVRATAVTLASGKGTISFVARDAGKPGRNSP